MSHSIISGMTLSGKTTLAKKIAYELRQKGHKIAVLDPMLDKAWPCHFITDNPDELMEFVRTNKDYMIFIDESGTAINKFNKDFDWLTTTARHHGHSSFLICHKLTQLSPILRGNCVRLYLFACGRMMANEIAEEYNEPELSNMPKIGKGEFFIVSRYEPLQRGKINFPDSGVVPLDKLTISCYSAT